MEKAELIELNSVEELEDVLKQSADGPRLLFKHSLTCSISREVFRSVSEIEGPVFLVTVQTARDVSNAVAEKTGVRHESPQALILENGECVYSASHFDITAESLRSRL